jgi:hypothetical protein
MDTRTNKVVSDLEGADSKHIISNGDPAKKHLKNITHYNRVDKKEDTYTKFDVYSDKQPEGDFSKEDILGHELKHAWNKLKGIFRQQRSQMSANGVTNCEEVDAVNFESIIRDKEYKVPRTDHGEGEIPKQDLVAPNDYKLQSTPEEPKKKEGDK